MPERINMIDKAKLEKCVRKHIIADNKKGTVTVNIRDAVNECVTNSK